MTAEQKITQKKLTLLQIAIRIRNVSEACRWARVCRRKFYEYKRAFHELGFIFLGLNDITLTQRTPFLFDIKINMDPSSNVCGDRGC
jgi:hypothetical protein